jgi:hypothetical protein
MAEVPAFNLLAISSIKIPISYNTELPLPDSADFDFFDIGIWVTWVT